jgi:cytochrome P450
VTTAASDVVIPSDVAATLVDPAAYADHRIHEAYRWLRTHKPLGLATAEGFDPFWAVTKHADIMEVSRQNSLFANGRSHIILMSRAAQSQLDAQRGGQSARTLVNMDPPDHLKYRLLTQSWFMPRSLERMQARIRGVARSTVERLLAMGGRCDFVRDAALGYPLRVIMETMGVPPEDEPLMLKLTQKVFGPDDPDTEKAHSEESDPSKVAAQLQAAVAEFAMYFSRLSAERRQAPRDDLATVIASAKINDQPLDIREELGYYIIIATAGHDTTSSSTAGAIQSLCEHPAEFAKLKADPSLIGGLVDEAIRWTTPVKHFMRCATADTELRGRKIAAGDLLMLCYASGNRDEEIYPDPYTFRVDRAHNKHIAFGYGGHVCLGQHLARMEMRILFEELIPRLKSLAFDGTPKHSQSTFINGPKTLPIRFEIA